MRNILKLLVSFGSLPALLCACQSISPDNGPDLAPGSGIIFAATPENLTKSILVNYPSQITDFKVWGNKYDGSSTTEVFSGTVVSRTDQTVAEAWDYEDHQPWEWNWGVTDYDFLALATGFTEASPTITPISPSATGVRVAYNVKTDDYDLMAAGVHRSVSETNPFRRVDFSMNHLLSAVQFYVYNDGVREMTDISIHLTNLVRSATCTYSKTGADWGLSWGSESVVYGEQFYNTEFASIEDDEFDYSCFYFAIPQYLEDISDESCNSKITISFAVGGTTFTYTKDLIEATSDGGTTDVWEPGKAYIYKLHFTPRNDVIVTVKTTEWETVEAETPGIILP